MKTPSVIWVAALIGAAKVAGHAGHHGHGEDRQVPLHERKWEQDSEEELQRKWSFEVSNFVLSFLPRERNNQENEN
jgi:hypothetical protein